MGRGSEAEEYTNSGISHQKTEKAPLKLVEPNKKEKNKWTTGQKVGAGFGIAIASGASTIGVLEGLEALGVEGPVIAKYIELKSLGIETAREALDKFTKETGIKIFNDQETQITPESREFTGLEIEGLNHVYQNGRWEYVDPKDNLVAGYWNDKEGKYEHMADVLKGEWKGLFVEQSLEEARNKLKENEEWTAEYWDLGEYQVPISFDITKGGVIEEIKALGNVIQGTGAGTVIGIKDLPSKTIVFSPFPFNENGASFGWSDNSANFDVDKDLIFFSFTFRNTSQCLIPGNGYPDNSYNGSEYSAEDIVLALGYPVLEVNDDDILPRMPKASINIINPFIKENIQLLISANKQEGGLISFSLKNFLRDEKGRFIFISPGSSEIEKMKSTIEKEMLNVTTTAEKQTLEENLEASSLIEKTETAPIINGLELNKETGFYLAKESNEYGLEKDAKAGIFKDGILGLTPEVISFLQHQDSDLKIPLPFNPEEINDLKIVEEEGAGYFTLIIRSSNEVTIYSPINGFSRNSKGNRSWGPQKGFYQGFNFDLDGKTTIVSITSKEVEYYPINKEQKVNIGDKLGKIKQDILIEFETCSLLKIGNNPVFILPNG